MAILPIKLVGDTLNQRHRNLNALVNDAFTSKTNFQEIQHMQEQSPVDRLFKIDLASKLKDVDYIMTTLKDDDMLFVSRALKCKWLLENDYKNIINPEYLDKNLYPHMTTTAVNKMKWWISIHLKEPNRCQQFYEYYYEKNFDSAIRFLTHCPVSYMLNEITKILHKLSPFYFKIFCEKSPEVAKIFFDSFETNESVLDLYLTKEVEYYDSLKVVLKVDSNIYLDITEKYFNNYLFKRLSSPATKFIMNNCKDRFTRKSELYTSWLLDMKTMAQCLTSEECKELVLILARAKYLREWFSYKNVEPLIKRLDEEERSAFKKKIFVDKEIGDVVENWPYKSPTKPVKPKTTKLFEEEDPSMNFHDSEEDIEMFEKSFCYTACRSDRMCIMKTRTLLDKLFDEYRFFSFEKTLIELKQRIEAENSAQNRQYMMLVLVSKTGGRAESVATLLQLLAKHSNEASHVRATIVRSLVKRAFVWRLPQESWESFCMFSSGLGLDGKPPEADCREGLHAVIIRSLLENSCIASDIFSAYIREFSTLKEYSLSPAERESVTKVLPELIQKAIVDESDAKKQAVLFNFLFDTLDEYKLSIDIGFVASALAALVNRDPLVAEGLLIRLFRIKKGRRELFEQNFAYISADASYVNALRHNIEVLKIEKYVKRILETDIRKERFLRKLAIYFTEKDGLAELYLTAIKEAILNEPKIKLAKLFAMLTSAVNLESVTKQMDSNKDIIVKRFVAALRANAHRTRPKLDIDYFGWKAIGVKAVTNKVQICPDTHVKLYLSESLKWSRTAKLAITLSLRVNSQLDAFTAVSRLAPSVALKCAIRHFQHNPDKFNQNVWVIVKPLLKKFDFERKSRKHLSRMFWNVEKIPASIRADYCTSVLSAAKKHSKQKTIRIMSYLEKYLPEVSPEFVEDFLNQFLKNQFTAENVATHKGDTIREESFYLRILVKFVLLSKLEETQMQRYETFAEPVLKIIKSVWDNTENKGTLMGYIKVLTKTMRYKTVYFNDDYVSCLPVFENIVTWMHSILPMEAHFSAYVNVHLNMLYFKSIRQCLKIDPEVFKPQNKDIDQLVDMLGRTFGSYIAKEVDELKSRYFDSIVELYANVLGNYLNDLFGWDQFRNEIMSAVVKGIVVNGSDTTPLIGVYVFKNNHIKDNENNEEMKGILKSKDNKELHFFLDCELYRI